MEHVFDIANRKVEADQGQEHGGSARVALSIGGMADSDWSTDVERAIAGVDGVETVQVDQSTATARVDYDLSRAKIQNIAEAIRSAGFKPGTAKMRLQLESMHLRSYARKLALAFLVTATALFVVEHWQRFNASDLLMLGAALVSAGVYWFMPPRRKSTRQKHWTYRPAKWRRR